MCSRALAVLLLVSFSNVICDDLEVFTVATDYNDAVERLLRSAQHNQFNIKILGSGTEWKGGDVSKFVGGGQKVNILRETLKSLDQKLVLFIDSYDVIFMDTKQRLLEEYRKMGHKVIFSAEDFCWPQRSLEQLYPTVGTNEKRFLNSGAFIGPADVLYKILSSSPIKDDEDDQLFYTNIFLNARMRKEFDIALDTKSALFQNLHGALSEVEVRYALGTGYLYNKKTETRPIVAHGNGPIKAEFNTLTNYLDYSWTPEGGCRHCIENVIELKDPKEYPIIQMSIFFPMWTPFMENFFQRIAALTYPKDRIHLTGYIAESAGIQQFYVDDFMTTYGDLYLSATWFDNSTVTDLGTAYDTAMANCLAIEDCQFTLLIHGSAMLTTPDTIEHLVHSNRSMLAPLVARRGKLWSNFWGALSKDGYYERSDDYLDILEGTKKGIWNVPFIRDVYLISRRALSTLSQVKFSGSSEPDMAITATARQKNIFMMVDNQEPYGYLINTEITSPRNKTDLWQIFDNPLDWEEKYVHPEYFRVADPEFRMEHFEQPCPDVFWVPLLSEKMCQHLIAEVENSSQWSDGSNYDPRLEGGYENVPTRDIHMRQIDWEEHWLHFLVKYVHPIQKKVFLGYDDKPWARMNFIVRYRPDEQPSLRPHHDASSYTLNIALNEPGTAYQGGGTRFIRYNCTLTQPRIGWAVIGPGRVTHLHEGLPTTAGTRYIFVTFVNP